MIPFPGDTPAFFLSRQLRPGKTVKKIQATAKGRVNFPFVWGVARPFRYIYTYIKRKGLMQACQPHL